MAQIFFKVIKRNTWIRIFTINGGFVVNKIFLFSQFALEFNFGYRYFKTDIWFY